MQWCIINMSGKEVTVSSTQGLTRVVSEVVTLLETQKEATITAINMAIPSAVSLVELIKHKVKGIYQQNSFERLKDSTKTKVIFKLSLNPLDSTHSGYQPPISESEVQEKSFAEMKKPPVPSSNFRKPEGGEKRDVDESKNEFYRNKPRSAWGSSRGRSSRGRTDRPEGSEKPVEKSTTEGETKPYNSESYRGRGENRGRDFRSRRGRGFRGSRVPRGGPRGRGRFGQRGGFRGGDRGPRQDNEHNQRREPGMEKYELVRNREELKKKENEIFVSNAANPILGIKEGLLIFKKNVSNTVVIKASGQALPKAVRVAEEIKRKEPGLHQQNSFQKRVIKDVYKPLEEGLQEVIRDRTIEGIEIVLSKEPLDTKHSGYQPPIAADLVTDLTVEQVEKL